MDGESLEAAIARVGSPVGLLGKVPARHLTFPVSPKVSCALPATSLARPCRPIDPVG